MLEEKELTYNWTGTWESLKHFWPDHSSDQLNHSHQGNHMSMEYFGAM